MDERQMSVTSGAKRKEGGIAFGWPAPVGGEHQPPAAHGRGLRQEDGLRLLGNLPVVRFASRREERLHLVVLEPFDEARLPTSGSEMELFSAANH